jgi:MFS superfamily sulfate permease-like transporter
MLVFVLLATRFIEMIPNTALAAMLITVGLKLAHPREFIHIFNIGREQLAIFLVTIFFTLYEDLLVGIAAGILLKVIIHVIHGAPLTALFKAPASVSFEGDNYLIEVEKAALFTNFLGLKTQLEAIPQGMHVTIDLSKTKLVDHSVMENLHHFEHDYIHEGGTVNIIGLDEHEPLSNHKLAARRKKSVVQE